MTMSVHEATLVLTAGHHMALNLFTKTFIAHHQSTSLPDPPEFLICESDDKRASSFLEAVKQKGGHDLHKRITRVGNGKEWAPRPPLTHVALMTGWQRAPRASLPCYPARRKSRLSI